MGKLQKNKFNIGGKVLFVGLPKWYSERMSKRMLVLEVYAGKYRQEVQFDFVNDNMPLLNNVRENDWAEVDFILRGSKSIRNDGKTAWYVNLEGKSCTVQPM